VHTRHQAFPEQEGQTTERSTQANSVQFNSILLRRSFKKCLILVYLGPAYLLLSSLSPVRVTIAY
jgi:hypothetical protein